MQGGKRALAVEGLGGLPAGPAQKLGVLKQRKSLGGSLGPCRDLGLSGREGHCSGCSSHSNLSIEPTDIALNRPEFEREFARTLIEPELTAGLRLPERHQAQETQGR